MNLTRIIVVVCTIVCTTVPMQGQWEIGGIAGINIAGIAVRPEVSSEKYGIYPGMGIGVVVNRELADRVDVHTAAMFLQKGGRITAGSDRVVYRITYFEIPLFIRYIFEIDLPVLPYAMAGPSLGFRSAAVFRYDDGYRDPANEGTGFFDLGAGFGGGIEVPRDRSVLFAELRYLHGLVNVNTEAGESSVKNRGVQALIGIAVPVGD